MDVRLGCAGWGYDDWVGAFYAPGTPPSEYLPAYARVFSTVEVDSSYYRAPSRAQCAAWAERTPAGFVFCPKVPQAIVRDARLRGVEEPLAEFLAALRPLAEAGKLGPVLAQLPPGLKRGESEADLVRFLDLVPSDVALAVEFRHASWHHEDVYALLRKRGAALAWAWTQYGTTPPELTADWAYVRLIGDRELTRFDRVQRDATAHVEDARDRLRAVAERLQRAFVFANNHLAGHAPASVVQVADALGVPRPELARAARGAGQRGLGEF